jgi:hypothetical protein
VSNVAQKLAEKTIRETLENVSTPQQSNPATTGSSLSEGSDGGSREGIPVKPFEIQSSADYYFIYQRWPWDLD